MPKKYKYKDLMFIDQHHQEYEAKELATKLGIDIREIRKIGLACGYKFKPSVKYLVNRTEGQTFGYRIKQPSPTPRPPSVLPTQERVFLQYGV